LVAVGGYADSGVLAIACSNPFFNLYDINFLLITEEFGLLTSS
jgi:hypothetical protein